MAWFTDTGGQDAKGEFEKALRLPMGAASPLWFVYAGAAGAGITYWWMSQWLKPVNLEAFSANLPALAKAPAVPTVVEQTIAALQPEPVASDQDGPDAETMQVEAEEVVAEAVEATQDAFGEAAKAMSIASDDLTRLVGIGPTLAAKLSDLGVKTFTDIASWTSADVEKFDKALDLKGRAVRESWIDQARQFAAQ